MNGTTAAMPDSSRDRDLALCRSILYEALSIGFRPPRSRTIERLVDRGAVAALVEAAGLIDAHHGTDLAPLAGRLAVGEPDGTAASLSASYGRLFGHTVKGPIPPYETEYGEDTLFQKPQEMSDVAAFFKAFGLILDPRRHERIDHIACEIEFLAFLARKEAHALERGDQEMLSATRSAARLFLKDHLGRFAPSFAHRVSKADPHGFYSHLAELCQALVASESARLAVPLGPEALRLRAPIDDAVPMACGVPGDCAPGACGAGSDGAR